MEKVPKKKPAAKTEKKKTKDQKLQDWHGSDFDSEEEYGNEGGAVSEGDNSDVEYDDGKKKDSGSESGSDSGYGSELGEDEMSESGEASEMGSFVEDV